MNANLSLDDYSRYSGNYGGERRSSGRKRLVLVVACAAMLLTLCASGVYAWFSQQDAVQNTFIKGEVAPVIEEEFAEGETVKSNVHVSIPVGCIDVYVRAQVSIYWQGKADASGNASVLWDTPVEGVGQDYSIAWGTIVDSPYSLSGAAGQWVRGADGFYYWTAPLTLKGADANKTTNLIDSVTVLKSYDDGRQLVVDIAAQSIESAKPEAFDSSWSKGSGLEVDANGILVKSSTAVINDAPAQ